MLTEDDRRRVGMILVASSMVVSTVAYLLTSERGEPPGAQPPDPAAPTPSERPTPEDPLHPAQLTAGPPTPVVPGGARANACARGDAGACAQLGRAAADETGPDATIRAAIAHRRACALGFPDGQLRSCLWVAEALEQGRGTPQRPERAALLRRALCVREVSGACSGDPGVRAPAFVDRPTVSFRMADWYAFAAEPELQPPAIRKTWERYGGGNLDVLYVRLLIAVLPAVELAGSKDRVKSAGWDELLNEDAALVDRAVWRCLQGRRLACHAWETYGRIVGDVARACLTERREASFRPRNTANEGRRIDEMFLKDRDPCAMTRTMQRLGLAPGRKQAPPASGASEP